MTPAEEARAECQRLAERYRTGPHRDQAPRYIVQEAMEDFAREWTTRLHDFSIWDDTSCKMLARWIVVYLDTAGKLRPQVQHVST